MAGIAFGNSYLAVAVIMLTCYNIGNQIAGESLYKVWAQESFPEESRTSFLGCISGASRLLCGLFALVTPSLVAVGKLQSTMLGSAGLAERSRRVPYDPSAEKVRA